MPMPPQTDTEPERGKSGREAIYAQKEPNVANDVTKTYWGLAALLQLRPRRDLSASLSSKGATLSFMGEVA